MNVLSILSQSPADGVVRLAEHILGQLGSVQVLHNRTGIAMLPYRDSAKGVTFHLSEVLIAEARVRCALPDGRVADGYGACLGRDIQHALAIALVDVAFRSSIATGEIQAFVDEQLAELERRDAHLLANVERTRVEMETF